MSVRHLRTSTISDALWLIGGIWFLAFVGMCLTVFVGSSDYPALGYIRAAVMAVTGACLSAFIWNLGATRQHSTAGRVLFFASAAIAATGIQLVLDLWSADLITRALGVPPPVRRIVSDNAVRAMIMGFLLRSNIAVFATAHALFGMAAIALSGAVDSRERDRMLAEAQATAAAAQLSALRYQLNPHFLFNTLNALQSLVESGRSADARTMIDRLSDFLRSTLTGSAAPTTTLEDELATIQDYLALERVRFGDRLVVQFDCPSQVRDAIVPSFVLQPLVENALKHGVAPALSAVEIDIGACIEGEDLLVWVRNDVSAAAAKQGTGVGLRNTRERLTLLYGNAASLHATATQESYLATLRLPLRKSTEA